MIIKKPHLIVIAGPNGAGKSTTAPSLLKGTLKVTEFVNADFAVARVAGRVRMGGHNVPEETVRRRCHAGIKNFFRLYKPLADFWRIYDNSDTEGPYLIASGSKSESDNIKNIEIWNIFMGQLKYEKQNRKNNR